MEYCSRCLQPNTRPGVVFKNGICGACLWQDESKIINNAIDYILEGQAKSKQLAILTKIHTLIEMEAKVKALRSRKVEVPILFVPPHVKKSQIYLPNNGEILIDDSIKNLIDWEQKGGKSIYFNEDLDSNSQFETVKTLSRIL